MSSAPTAATSPNPSIPWIAPFVVFVASMAVERMLGVPAQIGYPVRCLLTAATIAFVSRGLVRWRFERAWASIGLGLAIFVVWVVPDLFFGWRGHVLFTNALTGEAKSSLDPALRTAPWFLALRLAGSVLLVPILEELFWRGWLMRWLTERDFWKLAPGTASREAFWIVAVLFAAEHGPYWEVGLAAGILFNWWMMRTRSLADCILSHAAANAALGAYTIASGRWEYWL